MSKIKFNYLTNPKAINEKLIWLIEQVRCIKNESEQGPVSSISAVHIKFEDTSNAFTSVEQKAAVLINSSDSFTLTGDHLPIIECTYEGFIYVLTFNEIKAIGEFGSGSNVTLEESDLIVISKFVENIDFDPVYENTNIVPQTIGGYNQGQPATPPGGILVNEAIDKLIFPKILPTIIQPSFDLSLTGNNLRKIGANTTFDIIFNFNRGSIKGDYVSGFWDENEEQGKTAGEAISYTIDGQTGLASNILNVTKTVQQGINSFNGKVFYEEGDQPVDSYGDNVGSPLPAGNQTESNSFEGVYPLFATIIDITTLTELNLYSMLNANNIEIDLIGETGGNKQKFEIPDTWITNRGTPKVEYFNTVSNQYDPTDKIGDFDTTPETKTIEGNSVNYTRFTHNKSDRANIKIKLIL